MNLDFQQPKYVVPMILFPFLCLLFHVYRSTAVPAEEALPSSTPPELNLQLPGVSDKVRNQELEDKFNATRNQYRHAMDGYTAMREIQNLATEPTSTQIQNPYNEQEKLALDSLETLHKPSSSPKIDPKTVQSLPWHATSKSIHTPSPSTTKTKYEDPVDLFKAQMAVIDSFTKANDPAYQQKIKAEALAKKKAQEALQNTLQVKQVPKNAHPHFNTVQPHNATHPITAIIDQEIQKGTLGSRVRIRLLNDLKVGNIPLPKGTYLYATITGYAAERVQLTIESVLLEDQACPIHLDIHDQDGLKGLYVPKSDFRELSKNLGSTSLSTLDTPNGNGNTNPYQSTLQQLFRSTTQTMARNISKNKVHLKYGTVLLLMDQTPTNTHQPFNTAYQTSTNS